MEIFGREVFLRWMESSKITAVAWCYNNLIIGNDAGELYAFQAVDLQGPVEADVYKFAKVSNQSIACICPLEPEEWILVLNENGDLYSINAFFKGPFSMLCKNVTCVVRQLGDSSSDNGDTPNGKGPLKQLNQFCLGSDNKMYIYAAEGEKLTQQRCISVDGVVLSAAWLNNTIVVGTKEAYYIMDAECTVCHELCSLQTGDLDSEVVPLTAACVDGDIMVVCQNIGIFYNTQTMALSQKNTIHWRNRLIALGCVPPFIVGITVDRIVEIYGVRDQVLYQVIDQTSAKFFHYMPYKECMISSTSNVVTILKPKSYHQCVADMVERKDIKQVLHMVEVYFATEDPMLIEEKKVAHTIAGWMRFGDVNFPLAFQHFTLGDVDIVQLLEFWNRYADLNVPESYVRNMSIPLLLRRYIPAAMEIREFVEKRFNELKDVLPANTTSVKLLEMANVSFATFLLKHFNHKTLLQKHGRNMGDFQRKLTASIEQTCLLLLAECDDPKCSLIINRTQEETFLDLDACGQHLLKMDKREVFAKLLIKQKRYKEAMDIMVKYISDKVGTAVKEEITLEIKSVCCELATCLNTLIENSQQDKDGGNMDAQPMEINEALNMYLPVLLATYPNAALEVLTNKHAILPFSTDQIIAMIDMHAPKSYCASKMSMRIKYLEDLVIKTKHGSIHENTLLAKYYISELAMHKKNSDAKDDSKRSIKTMLVELLESNNNFKMTELEAMLMKLDIVEATVLLHNKLNRHGEALRTLCQRWNKEDRLKACEAYCLCFGEIAASYDSSTKEIPFKRLFSNFDYWMERAKEWPLKLYEMYNINSSDTSIDRLLLQLLTIIVQESETDSSCIYLARDLLAKYIPSCTHKSVLNGSAIVELIPDNWDFAIFANIFMQLQLKALHEQRTTAMRRGLTRSLHSQTAKKLYKLTCVPPITIDARSTCAICQEPIKLGMSIAIPPPTQGENTQQQVSRQHVIMHEQCAKNVHDK
ncbi:TGF beta receptor associated protein, putative [Babesia ovis]|uniref:TGF beta receptor associated protein, putative n=1 Tax=Babesia ovis TaxID=5869 RepID=A0A9W5WUC6_BABOV|nr:TGF beta receptor associated protein, putative [Babesia ovis]